MEPKTVEKRIWDAPSLQQFGQPRVEQVIAALYANQQDLAREKAEAMHREIKWIQDVFLVWIASFTAFIRERHHQTDIDQLWQTTVARQPFNTRISSPANITDSEQLQSIGASVRDYVESIEGVTTPEPASFNGSLLGQLRQQALQQLIAAIDRDDNQQAITLAEQVHQQMIWVHDLLMLWCTAIISFIGEQHGDKTVEQVWEQAVLNVPARATVVPEHEGDKGIPESMAVGTRGHGEVFTIEEKADAFELVIESCGSGGRLIQAHLYDGPDALYTLKGPSWLTQGQTDFPVYCAHCVFLDKFAPKDESGKAQLNFIASDKPGYGPCRARAYKRGC